MLVFIIIIAVLIFLIPKIIQMEKRAEASRAMDEMWEDTRRRAEQEQKKEKEEKQRQKSEHQKLEEKYAASPLTREIIRTISDDTGRKPEEITIYNDHVSGRTNGVMRTYDFKANRVPIFESAIKFSSDEVIDENFLVRPQIAIATAINRILGGEYSITDMAKRSAERKSFSDGDFYIQYGYISDHVIMRLKPTNNF